VQIPELIAVAKVCTIAILWADFTLPVRQSCFAALKNWSSGLILIKLVTFYNFTLGWEVYEH
jgi:hypothetical protein